ncbi:MAG TPA: SDR family oxidoreductase [Solirubrobacteraceae bacterium]
MSKVAVVTGGGSGIGEAICRRLASDGARVAVLDVNADMAALTAGLVDGIAVQADVSDSAAVDRALAETEERLGPVDVWVNNAGVTAAADHIEHVNARSAQQLAEAAGGEIRTPLEALVRITDEDWRRLLSVHLDGTFYGTRAAARSMAARRSGAIVNIASICGLEGCAGHPHYSAAKGGILAFTRAAAKELIVQGVRVNAIAPGFIATPMGDRALTPAMEAVLRVSTPIGRLGTPDEVAATVAFLAGEDAAFYVGDTLTPAGGYVTR